jgi:gliding motility-associated-like protein
MKIFKLYLSLFLFSILPIFRAAAQNQTVISGSTTASINFPATGCLYTWTNNTPAIGLLASGTGNIGAFTAINAGNSPIIATITATPITSGFGYIANLSSNNVSVISTANNSLVATIPVGAGPYGVSVSPDGSRAYIANISSNTVSVINTASNTVIATIPVGAGPIGVVVKPDGSRVYVANTTANTISIIDAATNTVTSTITGLSQPQGISVSPDGSRLYVTSGSLNTLTMINTSTAAIVSSVAVGGNPLCSILNPDGSLVYVGNQSGSVSVINAISNSAITTISTAGTPAGLAISPDGALLYVADPTGQRIDIISTASNTVTSTISIPTSPQGISLSPDGSRLYATDRGNSVSVVNTTTNAVLSKITVGSYPVSLGNFITPNLTCAGAPVSYIITVNPNPVITAGAVSGNISACQGSASTSLQQFTVTAVSLATDITATAPVGFEVSTSAGSGYANSITLLQTGGIVNSMVYVRSAASAAAGNLSGNVVLSSTGATNQNIAVTGTVNPVLTLNPVANQTVLSGSATTAINFTGTATWVNNKPGIGLAASGSGNIASFTAVNTTNAPIMATITATPASLSYAYIANSANGTVSVISTQTKTVVATIPVGSYPFGIAISPDNTLVYVVNSSSANVSVISTATNTVIATIPVGIAPQVVAFSRDGTRAYVASNNNTISIIDPATHTVINSIHTAAAPQGIVVSADGSKIYVSNNLAGTISVIDPITGTVLNTITVGSFTCGIALNPAGTRLYTANAGSNTMSVINTATNTVIASPGVPGNPQFVTVSPDGSKVYVASWTGYISVFNAATNVNITTVPESSPRSIGLTPDGLSIYLVSGSGYVDVQDLTFSNNTRIPVGTNPGAYGNFMAVGPGGCIGPPVTFTITVNPSPIVTAGAVSGSISACAGTVSSSPNIQQFTISGSGLSAGITATAPTGFEVSLTAGSGYTNSLTLTQASGVVSSTVIYVRSAATAAAGSLSGNVILSSPGAASQNIAVTGVVNALPTVNTIANQTVLNGAATTAINFTGTANTFSWVNNTPGIGLAASGVGNISSFPAVNMGGNPVTATITATPLNSGFAYIPNYDDGTVSVVGIALNKVISTIRTANHPYGVVLSPDGSLVYIAGSDDNAVSVISTSTNTRVSSIYTEYPSFLAISPDGTKLYIASSYKNTLSLYNTISATTTIISTLGIPQQVAVSPDGSKIYVGEGGINKVAVLDASTNNLITTIPVANPLGLALSRDGTRLYVSNGFSNSITVINTINNNVLTSIPDAGGPGEMELSPDGQLLYVLNSTPENVSVFNTTSNILVTTIPFNNIISSGMSLSPDGSLMFVTDAYMNDLVVFSTATNTILSRIPVGTTPRVAGNFVSAGSGCYGSTITFTITVNPTPNITIAGSLTAVNTIYGTPSVAAGFTLSGANLTTGVLVTPPAGFEVSSDNVNFSNTVTIGGAGAITAVPVYIRLAAVTAAGSYSGNVVLTSTGAQSVNVAMPVSTVSPALLTITANDAGKTYGNTLTNTNSSTAFSITAGALKNGNTIASVSLTYGNGTAATAAVGTYPTILAAINTTGGGFVSSNYTITYGLGNIVVTPAALTITASNVNKPNATTLMSVYSTAFTAAGLQNHETVGSVMLNYGNGSATADAAGLYPGSVVPSNATGGTFNASNYTITYQSGDITVLPPVAIITTGSLTALNTIYGTPSSATGFSTSGTNLTAGILVTPPAGFEVSIDNTKFYPTVTIGASGNIAATQVYIRLSALTAVGTDAGNILLSSAGTTNTSLVMPISTVNAAPLTITADDKTKVFGTGNPVLTASYSGFVNNETVARISVLPIISTTAAKTSAVGQYTITAGGAVAPNYNISYLTGVLTVTPLPVAIVIPNTFTPNDDGVNDLWNISALAFYPNNVVNVYDRSGALVFHSSGYNKPWDGTFNGNKLPTGTYYYIISVEMSKNTQTLSGPVSVIR